MYTIDHDREAGLLRLRLTGFWTGTDMAAFARDLRAVLAKARRGGGSLAILSDCRDYPVQSVEVGASWARLLGADSGVTERYAVVVGSVLNKIQAERVLAAPSLRVFTDMDTAVAWLGR